MLSLGPGVWGQVMDDHSVIGRSLFKKETSIQLFVGLKVHLSTGELGVIDSAFGQSGKFKIRIPGECGPVAYGPVSLWLRSGAGRGGGPGGAWCGVSLQAEPGSRPESEPLGTTEGEPRVCYPACL